jgi:hypothetical protein
MGQIPSKVDERPGRGFLGWLGRQVGYVSKAIKAPVPGAPEAKATVEKAVPQEPKVLYRNDTVSELPHPDDPNLKLRRTIIDEVVVEPKPDGKE